YRSKSVLFKDDEKSFDIRKFTVPEDYRDIPLELHFNSNKSNLINPKTEEIIFSGTTNTNNQLQTPKGLWQVSIFSHDQPNDVYLIEKQSLPAAVDKILADFSVAEKGKMTGVLGLNYQGQDKEHITQVLNSILAAYSQQNIERRS